MYTLASSEFPAIQKLVTSPIAGL